VYITCILDNIDLAYYSKILFIKELNWSKIILKIYFWRIMWHWGLEWLCWKFSFAVTWV